MAVILPSRGYVYVADASTAMPTFPLADPTTAPAGWASVGNTSLENGISRAVDGDDPETLGSWQNPTLRTSNPTKTRSITMNLLDHTTDTYQLYYGGGTIVDETGLAPYVEGTSTAKGFKIPSSSTPQNKALLIVAVDGDMQVPEYYPMVSFLGADEIEIDVTQLAEVPVTGTILDDGGDYGLGVIGEAMAF